MTIAELLEPLDKYRVNYIKIHTNDGLYIYNMDGPSKELEIYRWFGNCRVKLWRADFGDSLYIEI